MERTPSNLREVVAFQTNHLANHPDLPARRGRLTVELVLDAFGNCASVGTLLMDVGDALPAMEAAWGVEWPR